MTRPKNSDIKTDRIRAYFVDAAKTIILRDGAEGVTVRGVAELAGYSYATIYNYFADLDRLLQATKDAMIQDMMAYMEGADDATAHGVEAIKRLNRKYARYFVEHPHVFHFFYAYRAKNGAEPDRQPYNFEASWQSCYQELVDDGVIRQEDVMIVARTVIYALQGLLSLYFSDNGLTREMLFSELDAVTDYIIGGQGV